MRFTLQTRPVHWRGIGLRETYVVVPAQADIDTISQRLLRVNHDAPRRPHWLSEAYPMELGDEPVVVLRRRHAVSEAQMQQDLITLLHNFS